VPRLICYYIQYISNILRFQQMLARQFVCCMGKLIAGNTPVPMCIHTNVTFINTIPFHVTIARFAYELHSGKF
jgi:hypothetical protein